MKLITKTIDISWLTKSGNFPDKFVFEYCIFLNILYLIVFLICHLYIHLRSYIIALFLMYPREKQSRQLALF